MARPQPQPAAPQPPIARGAPGGTQAGAQGSPRGETAGPALPSADLANAPDPAIVADAFYRTYLAIRSPGVPDARQRARLRPFLSTSLDAELEAAEKAEQFYRAKTNGAVPPLVEGDLFASLFEGASEVSVGDCAAAPPFVQCTLQMAYIDPNTRQRVQWQDMVVLARQRGHWRVHDMTYQSEFGLGRHGTLLGFLRIVVKEARE